MSFNELERNSYSQNIDYEHSWPENRAEVQSS